MIRYYLRCFSFLFFLGLGNSVYSSIDQYRNVFLQSTSLKQRGSTHFQCSTQIISESPWQTLPITAGPAAIPESCEDFSGSWVGGCSYDVFTKNWPRGAGGIMMPIPLFWDSVVTVVPRNETQLLAELKEAKTEEIQIKQNGCKSFSIDGTTSGPQDPMLSLSATYSFAKNYQIRRFCRSDYREWNYTFPFHLSSYRRYGWKTPKKIRMNQEEIAENYDYDAKYHLTRNNDLYFWNGMLRFDQTVYSYRNFDPKELSVPTPHIGGMICLYRKK